jgi:hypothetical protein
MSEHPGWRIDLGPFDVFAKRDDIVGSPARCANARTNSVRPWPTSSLQSTRVQRALAA